MRITSLHTLQRHLSDAAPDHLAPVYLLLSKDAFELKLALQAISRAFLPSGYAEVAQIALDGEVLRAPHLSAALESGELFCPRRIVALQNCDKLPKPLPEEIQRYLELPHPAVCLVICAAALTRTTNFYKCLEKLGVIFEARETKEKEGELLAWINAHFIEAGKQIAPAAAARLVHACSGERYSLYNEMEKLLCHLGERPSLTLADVEALVPYILQENIWQLADALLSGEAVKAQRIVRQSAAQDSDFFPFVRLMRSQFQTLCQIASLTAHGAGSEAVQHYLPQLKGGLLHRQIALAQRAGFPRLKRAIIKIDEIELKAKNSSGTPALLIDILLTSLIT